MKNTETQGNIFLCVYISTFDYQMSASCTILHVKQTKHLIIHSVISIFDKEKNETIKVEIL